MTLFKQKFRVESHRLPRWDYSKPGLYFVTICTKNRECYLGEILCQEMKLSQAGKIVRDEWMKTEQIRWGQLSVNLNPNVPNGYGRQDINILVGSRVFMTTLFEMK